jgi:EmrB/QacA subfamily drug resistance transporter
MGATADDTVQLSPAARRLVFAGLMLAIALPAFDLLSLATAAKDIVDDLGGEIIWMFVAYQILLVASMPLYGKLGDIYGRRVTFRTAIVLFVAGSIVAGLSTSMTMLIAARAIQGIAGGGIIGQAQAVLADVVPPRERGRVAWIQPTVFTAASMAGPLIGGFFVDTLSWRWIFFVSVPAGSLAFFAIGGAFRVEAPRVEHRLDVLGSVLLVGAVTTIAFVASTAGESYAWASPVILGGAATGVALAVLFVLQERRAPEPVFPVHLLRDRIIGVCVGIQFCIGAANFGMAVFLPLFLRVVTGVSATEAGLALLPVSVGIMATSTVVGRTVTRTGRYRWYPMLGAGLFALGVFMLSTLDQGSGRGEVWLFTFVAGAGSGCASPVIMLAMQNAARYEDVGVVSSLGMFSRTMGQVFGPAFAAMLIATRFPAYLQRNLDADAYAALDTRQLRTETGTIDALDEPVRGQVVEAFRMSVNDGFRLAALFAACGIVTAAFMRTRPLRMSIRDEAGAPAGQVKTA